MPADKPRTEGPTPPQLPEAAGMGFPLAVGNVAIQTWMEMGTEALRFIKERLQQDTKTQQEMLACTSLDDLRRVQIEFFNAAQEQYAAEAAKMLELMGKATAQGLLASSKARRYDDVPL